MKLRTKLLFFTLFPIAVAVSIIIYKNYNQSIDITSINVKSNLQSSANFIAESVNLISEDIKSSLYLLSISTYVKKSITDPPDDGNRFDLNKEFLEDIASRFPFSRDIFVLDEKGDTTISTNIFDKGQNYSDREYFVQAMNGSFCISHAIVSRATKKDTVYFSAPVYISGKISGVIVVSVQVEQMMENLFKKIYIAPQTQILVTDRNGTILSKLNTQLLDGDITDLYIDILSKENQDTSFIHETLNEAEYTGYFQKLKYNKWVITALITNSDLYALTHKSIIRNIALTILCLLFIFIIVAVSLTKLSSALIKGLGFAKKVTEGDFNAQLDVYSSDEIGQLYDALRTMMLTIQKTQKELQDVLDEKDDALNLARENLTKESALIKIILNNIPDMIFYKNTEGVYEGCNKAFADFLGKSMDEIVGKTDFDLFSPEIAAQFLEDDKEVFQSDAHAKTIEESVGNSDGKCIILETLKTIYYAHEYKPLGLIGVSRDISLRKEAENALALASEKAIEASNAKSEFVARMSHEIRTPLNAIIGMTYLLQKICTEPKQVDGLYKIDISAKNLLAIINDVLDFSKIEAGKVTIEKMPFDIAEAMSELTSINEAKAVSSNISFSIHIDEKINKNVIGDRLRIMQVLINLTSNALKFTNQGYVNISVNLESSDDISQICVFSIKDSGIGMSEAQMERLFSAFTQADGSITRRYGGTGLGLAISKMLVELMGGSIWLESRPGLGTSFFFRLCLETDKTPHQHEPRAGLDASGGPHDVLAAFTPKTVLVVEDNSINQEIAQEILRMFGLNVSIAENGQEAIKACEAKDFDLILMDIQMPIMNGYTATKILREMPRYKHVPILAMSANAFMSDREACLEAGMNEHVAKPFDPQQVKRILEKWLHTSLC